MGGVIIHKVIITELFNYLEQDGYLKILTGCVWGNDGCEKDSCPSIALNLKNDTKTYFESSEPPQKFIRPPFLKKKTLYARLAQLTTLALRYVGEGGVFSSSKT